MEICDGGSRGSAARSPQAGQLEKHDGSFCSSPGSVAVGTGTEEQREQNKSVLVHISKTSSSSSPVEESLRTGLATSNLLSVAPLHLVHPRSSSSEPRDSDSVDDPVMISTADLQRLLALQSDEARRQFRDASRDDSHVELLHVTDLATLRCLLRQLREKQPDLDRPIRVEILNLAGDVLLDRAMACVPPGSPELDMLIGRVPMQMQGSRVPTVVDLKHFLKRVIEQHDALHRSWVAGVTLLFREKPPNKNSNSFVVEKNNTCKKKKNGYYGCVAEEEDQEFSDPVYCILEQPLARADIVQPLGGRYEAERTLELTLDEAVGDCPSLVVRRRGSRGQCSLLIKNGTDRAQIPLPKFPELGDEEHDMFCGRLQPLRQFFVKVKGDQTKTLVTLAYDMPRKNRHNLYDRSPTEADDVLKRNRVTLKFRSSEERAHCLARVQQLDRLACQPDTLDVIRHFHPDKVLEYVRSLAAVGRTMSCSVEKVAHDMKDDEDDAPRRNNPGADRGKHVVVPKLSEKYREEEFSKMEELILKWRLCYPRHTFVSDDNNEFWRRHSLHALWRDGGDVESAAKGDAEVAGDRPSAPADHSDEPERTGTTSSKETSSHEEETIQGGAAAPTAKRTECTRTSTSCPTTNSIDASEEREPAPQKKEKHTVPLVASVSRTAGPTDEDVFADVFADHVGRSDEELYGIRCSDMMNRDLPFSSEEPKTKVVDGEKLADLLAEQLHAAAAGGLAADIDFNHSQPLPAQQEQQHPASGSLPSTTSGSSTGRARGAPPPRESSVLTLTLLSGPDEESQHSEDSSDSSENSDCASENDGSEEENDGASDEMSSPERAAHATRERADNWPWG